MCYVWLQKRVQEHPLGFSLLPSKFSLRDLQNLYESILNVNLTGISEKSFFQWTSWLTSGEEKNVPHHPGQAL